MGKEKVFEPELERIQQEEYYLFYEMMMQSLRTDNVKMGVNRSLSLLRIYLQSGNIVMYKKNKDGIYIYRVSDTPLNETIKILNYLVNKTSPLVEKKEMVDLDLHYSEDIDNVMLMSVRMKELEYIVAINNYNKELDLDPYFWDKLKDTLKIIIKRADSYERNVKAINMDLLTGLNNRNAYERRIQKLDESTEGLVFGIFDLFRLKHINDNYSHATGDKYIQESAKILDKYWPKYKMEITYNGIEKRIKTGHCVYRIGGDEFVLLTTKENIEVTKIKAQLASEEIKEIMLDNAEDIPLGLNCGIVEHIPGDKIKTTYMNADKIMSEDKKQMYLRYGLERRK